mgnify:CR=1 FL=1
MKEELLYQIALTLIEGVGDVNAKSLLAYCGSAESVFKQKKSSLLKIPGIGEYSAGSSLNSGTSSSSTGTTIGIVVPVVLVVLLVLINQKLHHL